MTLAKGWTDTMDRALTNPAWDTYDSLLQAEITEYNRRFGFSLQSKIFKALIWTESGGVTSPAWTTRPMQIGNAGDPGWDVVRHERENTGLIMSDAVRKALATTSINNPQFNIKVGLVYAITKLSTFTTVVSDPTPRSYTIVGGDNLTKIARKAGSTIQNLMTLNPATYGALRPGKTLTYQRAAITPTACTVTPALLQSKYNAGGDSTYSEKLQYCLDLIGKLKR